MAGASAATRRVTYVNLNWAAGEDGCDGEFSVLIVTEDGERHTVTPSPAATSALIAVTQASNVLLWDPEHRTVVAANLVGEFVQDDWRAGDPRRPA